MTLTQTDGSLTVFPPDIPQKEYSVPRWLMVLTDKTALFYIKPFIAKWLKTFKSPSVLVISDNPVNKSLWQKILKAQEIEQQPITSPLPTEQYDAVILLASNASETLMTQSIQALKPMGAWVLITENQFAYWQKESWQVRLESWGLNQLFYAGFHPQGAVSWWPIGPSWWAVIGIIIENLAVFIPGKPQLAERLGPCWIIRGFKRYDATQLT